MANAKNLDDLDTEVTKKFCSKIASFNLVIAELIKNSRVAEELSTSTKISTDSMARILDSLKGMKNRETTKKNYISVWRQFNKFIIKLDDKPTLWEDRVSLFSAYLIKKWSAITNTEIIHFCHKRNTH